MVTLYTEGLLTTEFGFLLCGTGKSKCSWSEKFCPCSPGLASNSDSSSPLSGSHSRTHPQKSQLPFASVLHQGRRHLPCLCSSVATFVLLSPIQEIKEEYSALFVAVRVIYNKSQATLVLWKNLNLNIDYHLHWVQVLAIKTIFCSIHFFFFFGKSIGLFDSSWTGI